VELWRWTSPQTWDYRHRCVSWCGVCSCGSAATWAWPVNVALRRAPWSVSRGLRALSLTYDRLHPPSENHLYIQQRRILRYWFTSNYHKWESVKGVSHGLGRLNVSHPIMLRKVKFYKHLCLSSNSILYNLLYFTLIHNYTSDNMLRSVFMPQCSAVDLVYRVYTCLMYCCFFELFFFSFYAPFCE